MIAITPVGADSLKYALQGLQSGLRELQPVFRGPIYGIFKRFIQIHFTSSGTYSGENWKPLNPRYAAWKAKEYPGMGILRRTDRLYKSLQGGPEKVLRVTKDSAEFGTSVPYAVYHHAANRGQATFPRRLVIPPLTKAEGERIVDAILAYLFSKMRGVH